jgi:hypothetical protein
MGYERVMREMTPPCFVYRKGRNHLVRRGIPFDGFDWFEN